MRSAPSRIFSGGPGSVRAADKGARPRLQKGFDDEEIDRPFAARTEPGPPLQAAISFTRIATQGSFILTPFGKGASSLLQNKNHNHHSAAGARGGNQDMARTLGQLRQHIVRIAERTSESPQLITA